MNEANVIAKNLSELETQYAKLNWIYYTTGYDMGLEKADQEVKELYKDKSLFEKITSGKERATSELEKREFEVLYRTFSPYHQSPEAVELDQQISKVLVHLKGLINNFRYQLDGKDITSIQLGRMISESDDRETRKRACLARTQINKPLFEEGFGELVRLRKEYAQACGFANFVDFKLYKEGMDSSLFSNWEKQTTEFSPKQTEFMNSLASEKLGLASLEPWDQRYLKNQICSYIGKDVDTLEYRKYIDPIFKEYGFDLSEFNIVYDLFPRANKSEWAYNFCIEVGKESRILANMDRRFGNYWTLLHETAHAVHFGSLNPEEYAINRSVPGIVAEGIANLFGDLGESKEFIQLFFPQEVDKSMAEFSSLSKFKLAESLSYVYNIMFDTALYTETVNNYSDLVDIYWSKYRLTGRLPYFEEPLWGAIIHFTTHPIYMHNYLFGDVMRDALAGKFQESAKIEKFSDQPKKFGQFLKEKVIAPSGRYDFPEFYENLCGRKMEIESYFNQ